MSSLSFLVAELAELERLGLLRLSHREPCDTSGGRPLIDLTSNDYLGLGRETVSRETSRALERLPPGAGASRLLDGTHPAHESLEHELARWVGMESALLFASGYAANLGLLASLAGAGDLIVSDELNHASLVDGCRLSRAQIQVIPHLDLDALRTALQRPARRRLVVTESLFSMDGDSPDLASMRTLCDEHEALLIVDDAHALGVLGPRGAGLCADTGIKPDVLVGTLGKALGTSGAFVAGPAVLRQWLWNRARPFVYSTATSPLLAELTRLHLQYVQHADGLREHLRQIASRLASSARCAGLAVPETAHAQILPVLLGSPDVALRAAETLRSHGISARAIRPPTVPEGTSRLRLSLHARLTWEDVDRILEALRSLHVEL